MKRIMKQILALVGLVYLTACSSSTENLNENKVENMKIRKEILKKPSAKAFIGLL